MTDKITTGYNITTDPNFLDKQNAITLELSRKLERFHKLALDGKKSSVQKILDAIEQYPENPQLKNYLSVLYGYIGDTKRLYETNRWIIAEHPNYLFGKLNLANEYYLKKEYHKMPEVLGEAMELKALYPNRDTFHLNEVISFFKCAILYFTAIGDIEQAEVRYEIMQELAPDALDTEVALNQLFAARMEAGRKRFEEEEKSRISVETKKQEIKTISKAPQFNHEEIECLYSNGLYISEDKLNTILSLPKETLIADLELVLQDSIDRFGYFSNLVEEEEWDEERMNFVVHAIYLLGELESASSLKSFFKVLSQSDEYFELYLGDFSSMIWEPLYKLAGNNPEACKQFMFEPGINTFAKTNFPDMVEQLALHQPDRRNEVIQWFKDVIDFFLTSKLEDNVIDSDLIGLLICNVIDIDGIELLPEIEALFEKCIVSIGICGDWEEVKEAFERPDNYDKKKEILPITERYKQIISTWAGYNEEKNNSSFDYDDYFEPSMPIITEPKIGRNDPCPCGSGKKYKKCCLNN
jgi:hypothetical protein